MLDKLNGGHMVEAAIEVATSAHHGETDLIGEPYILHPLRIMLEVQRAGGTPMESAIAVMHDVLEHDPRWENHIATKFPPSILKGLKAITRKDGESYVVDYINRVMKDPIAHKIKIYDLLDNLNPDRIARLSDTPKTRNRISKYVRALRRLRE